MLKRSFATLAIAAALAVGPGQAVRAASDQPVSGTIVSQQVTGPACTSPVGLCTAGEFRGAVRGAFTFSATSLTPSADTTATGVVFYTGDIVIHTRDGDLLAKDAGAFNTGPSGDVASISAIVSGTGALTGATGYLRIAGLFHSGCTGCEYEGTLHLP